MIYGLQLHDIFYVKFFLINKLSRVCVLICVINSKITCRVFRKAHHIDELKISWLC
jgi:hypothetical protein